MLGRGGSWIGKSTQQVTTAQMNALVGVAGQMVYNTSYNAFFTWTVNRWWPNSNPDPRYGFVWAAEDFTGADRISTLDWSANSAQVAGNLLNTGQASVSITTAAQISRMGMQANSIQLGTMDTYIEAGLQMPTAPTAVEDGVLVFGYSDATAYDLNGAGTDGAYLSVNRAVNGSSLICYTQSNVASSVILTTANIVAATYYRLGVLVSANTSAQYFINGSSLGSISTTIPSGAGRQTGVNFAVFKTAGSANPVSWTVDYFAGWGFYNGARYL